MENFWCEEEEDFIETFYVIKDINLKVTENSIEGHLMGVVKLNYTLCLNFLD